MDQVLFDQMAELQARHWWFVAKRLIVTRVLRRFAAPATGRNILEVGCGTGSMAPVLRPLGRPVGMDAHVPALRHVDYALRVGGNLHALPFAAERFDLVASFDVLYHRRVGDVGRALGEIYRVCRPGALVVVTDSASPRLMSAHDVAFHGARRFRLDELADEMRAAGFEVLRGSYYHTILFPLAALVRLAKRVGPEGPGDDARGRSDLWPVPGWLNAALIRLYRIEASLAGLMRLPFGLSLIIVARRPERASTRERP